MRAAPQGFSVVLMRTQDMLSHPYSAEDVHVAVHDLVRSLVHGRCDCCELLQGGAKSFAGRRGACSDELLEALVDISLMLGFNYEEACQRLQRVVDQVVMTLR